MAWRDEVLARILTLIEVGAGGERPRATTGHRELPRGALHGRGSGGEELGQTLLPCREESLFAPRVVDPEPERLALDVAERAERHLTGGRGVASLAGPQRDAGTGKRKLRRICVQLVAVQDLCDGRFDGRIELLGRLGAPLDLGNRSVQVGVEPAPLGDRAVLDHHGPGEHQAVEERGPGSGVFERRVAEGRFVVQGRGGIEHLLDDHPAIGDLTLAAAFEPVDHLGRVKNAHRRMAAVVLAVHERAGVPDRLVLGPRVRWRRVGPREQELVEDAFIVLKREIVRQRQASLGPAGLRLLGRRCRRRAGKDDNQNQRDDQSAPPHHSLS